MAVNHQGKSSNLFLGAILIFSTGCAGAVISKEKMAIGAIGRSYIEACRTPVKEDAITAMVESRVGSSQLESRKWARMVGSPDGTAATTVPLQYEEYCVKVGNNTPASGFWGSVIELLGTVAPYVAAYFGLGAL